MEYARGVALLAAVALTAAPYCGAQARTTDSATVADRDLFHRSDLIVAGGFALGTVGMFPLDRHLASVLRDERLGSADLKRIALAFRFLGAPGPLVASGGAFLFARITHNPPLAEVSLHTAEAVGVAVGLTAVIKIAVGRERPYVSADTNPRTFRLLKGNVVGDFSSFPSGHTAVAFSAAAALVAETHEKWPRLTKVVAPLAYAGAAGVGLSRMYDDKHWASDVVMGAAIGTFAGLKTVRFNHTHAGNRLDRWLLGNARQLTVLPGLRGVFVNWSR